MTGQVGHGCSSPARASGRQRVLVELDHAGRALPVGHAEAVGAGVAAADDHHVLAGGVDRGAVLQPGRPPGWPATRCSIARCTPRSVAARGLGVSRPASAPQASSTASKRSRRSSAVTSTPTSTPVAKTTPSAAIWASRRVDVPLLHLEVGDAVAEQPADPVVALVDGDRVPGPGQLLGGGQAGRAGADHGDPLAGRRRRRLRAARTRGRTRGWRSPPRPA